MGRWILSGRSLAPRLLRSVSVSKIREGRDGEQNTNLLVKGWLLFSILSVPFGSWSSHLNGVLSLGRVGIIGHWFI